MQKLIIFLILQFFSVNIHGFSTPKNADKGGFSDEIDDDYDFGMHSTSKSFASLFSSAFQANNKPDFEKSTEYWNFAAQHSLRNKILQTRNFNVARNVIIFIGDGMSIPTITASRIYLGQSRGQTGEESKLFFENFPYVGLTKTYCVDKQTADSACSATAYLSGIKANYGTIGVNANVELDDCKASSNRENQVSSILEWAQKAGKATGIVTNTRITHASPAGTYAHTANREWECDNDIEKLNGDPTNCDDIAKQLIRNVPGRNLNVIFGGGRKKFLPKHLKGQRNDNLNLIDEWTRSKKKKIKKTKFIYSRNGLMELDTNRTNFVLGLFAKSHLPYHLDADLDRDPTLSELTAKALEILMRNPNGFVLFVEGGRIDHAHHRNLARKALDETVQFSDAVRVATKMVDVKETLIIVTADHSHTLSIAGYSNRGKDILGFNTERTDDDESPYTTLSYSNGPSSNGSRSVQNITRKNLKSKDFRYPSLYLKEYETHGGDDVAVFAIGPWSHLFTGIIEQNVIPHYAAFASCIGNGITVCQ